MNIIIIYVVMILSLNSGTLTKVEVRIETTEDAYISKHQVIRKAYIKYKEKNPNDLFKVLTVKEVNREEVED